MPVQYEFSEGEEERWIKEFESIGPEDVRRHVDNYSYPQSHPKRFAAIKWLREQESGWFKRP